MVVSHRRKLNGVGDELPNFVFNNEVIKRVEKIKLLGINIDESLNREEQYKTVKNKLKGGINSLNKLQNILSQQKLEQEPSLKAIFAMVILFGMLFLTPNYPNCRDYK